jgi:hypothetical protein
MRVSSLVVAVGLGACSPALPPATEADVTIAAERWPGATLAGLERGRALYVDRCRGCHALKLPDDIAHDRWPAEIAEMRNEHGVELTDREADSIERYLWSVGARLRKPLEPGSGPR